MTPPNRTYSLRNKSNNKIAARWRKMGLAFALSALANMPAFANDSPLMVQNCGHDLTFDTPPQSVVTIGQATTEALYILGLSDRMRGTVVWFTDVLPEYQTVNETIERLANNAPSFAAVVNKRPEFVISQYEWYVGPKGSVGTREQFHDLGVPTYIWPADCVGKDNSIGIDGTRDALFSTELIYHGLEELSMVFDVPDAGQKAIAELRAREVAAIALHDLNQAFICDWVAVLDKGRLAAFGPPADILIPETIEPIFKVTAKQISSRHLAHPILHFAKS